MLLKRKRGEGLSLSLEQMIISQQTSVDWDMVLERLEMLAHHLQSNDTDIRQTILEIRPDILYAALECQSPAIPCHVLSKFLQLSQEDEDPSFCFMSAVWNDELSYEACLEVVANRMTLFLCDPEDLRKSFYFALEDTFGKNGDTCNFTFARALLEIHPFILFSSTNNEPLPLIQLTSNDSVNPWNKKTKFVLSNILEKGIILKRNAKDVDFVLGGLLTEIDEITPLQRICENNWRSFHQFLKENASEVLEDPDFKRLVSRIILSAAIDRELETMIELIETCPSALMSMPLEEYQSPFSEYCEMCLWRGDGSCPDASVVQTFITQGRQSNIFTTAEHGGLLQKIDGSRDHHFAPFDTLSNIFYLEDPWDFLDVIVKEVGLLCVIQRCIYTAWSSEHAAIWEELAFRYKDLLDRFTVDDFNSVLHFLASASVDSENKTHVIYTVVCHKYRSRIAEEELCQTGRYLLHEAIRGCRHLPHINVDVIKIIANSNLSVLGKTDPLTGLPPFLLASSIDRNSKITIGLAYELLRLDPSQCQSAYN